MLGSHQRKQLLFVKYFLVSNLIFVDLQPLDKPFTLLSYQGRRFAVVVGVIFLVHLTAQQRVVLGASLPLDDGELKAFDGLAVAALDEAVGIDVALPVVGIVSELVPLGGLDVLDHILAQLVDPAVELHRPVPAWQQSLGVILW